MVAKVDIGNRALQMCGSPAFGRITDFDTDDTQAAAAVRAAYDATRKKELRRNYWSFALRRKFIRATQADDKVLTPATYSAATTYAINQLVVYSGQTYRSRVSTNLANTPSTAVAYWEVMSTPLIASEWDDGLTYYRHELVFVSTDFFLSLTNSPDVGTTPVDGSEWKQITGGTSVTTPYYTPLDGRTYAYVLPDDFLRAAPYDPRYPQITPDWLYENRQILTDDAGPLSIRYVRDEEDVTRFDVSFNEALAASIALEIVEELTQSNKKMANIGALYTRAVEDARTINAIESGPQELDEDDWITVRL